MYIGALGLILNNSILRTSSNGGGEKGAVKNPELPDVAKFITIDILC